MRGRPCERASLPASGREQVDLPLFLRVRWLSPTEFLSASEGTWGIRAPSGNKKQGEQRSESCQDSGD